MELAVLYAILFFTGVISSFVGTIVGGGGLISLPILILLGLPPKTAVATNSFGSLGLSAGALTKFWSSGKINWKYTLPFSIISIIGAFFGVKLLISVNEELLPKIIGIIILAVIPFLYMKPDLGIKKRQTGKFMKILGYATYFIIAVYGAFISAGGAIFLFFILMYFFGFSFIEGNATARIPALFSKSLAIILFFIAGLIDFKFGPVLFAGMLVGGYLGAHTTLRLGESIAKKIYMLAALALGIKLLFF